jgi:hypothetical protein
VSAENKKIIKVTLTLKRDRWRLVVLQLREDASEPELAFRGKYDSLADALDGFEDWRRGVVIV